MQLRQFFALGTLAVGLTYCAPSTPPAPAAAPEEPTLKSVFAEHFTVGAALGAPQFTGKDTAAAQLVAREYNTITPENVLKWGEVNPEPGVYNWEAPDAYVKFGEDHNMFIVGHTLVWHSQLAEYVKEIKAPELLRAALKEHIDAVAGRYKGRIDGWDVVNEALNEDGTMRKSVFFDVLGEDFMTDAFKMAEEAAGPETELYYNDYNMWNADKRNGAIRIINKIRENGGRVDGVGMQGHYSLASPSIDTIEQSIKAFAEAGLKVMITELDVTVLPNPWDLVGAEVSQNFEGSPFMNPYPEGLPDSVQTALAVRYEDLFRLFLKHSDDITRVTLWGVNDGHSWLNGWPIRGRTNYPLLFDRQNGKKPAYERVMALKK